MSEVGENASGVPEIDLTEAEVLRDPRVFADPERLDISRAAGAPGHLGYAHGPHFCLGAAPARVRTEVALAALLRRLPGLALAGVPGRVPDPGTWRLAHCPSPSDPGPGPALPRSGPHNR